MRSPARSTCPICGKQAESPPENAAFPFCSPQCKLVDLGRWLEGSYRVPGPSLDSDDFSEGADRASDGGDYEEEA